MGLKQYYAIGHRYRGKMNPTEAAYSKCLELQKHAGEIFWYEREAMRLKLADKTYYVPDFIVVTKNLEVECHEVKGFMKESANVKIKVASAKFPFRFKLIKKRGSNWDIVEIHA